MPAKPTLQVLYPAFFDTVLTLPVTSMPITRSNAPHPSLEPPAAAGAFAMLNTAQAQAAACRRQQGGLLLAAALRAAAIILLVAGCWWAGGWQQAASLVFCGPPQLMWATSKPRRRGAGSSACLTSFRNHQKPDRLTKAWPTNNLCK